MVLQLHIKAYSCDENNCSVGHLCLFRFFLPLVFSIQWMKIPELAVLTFSNKSVSITVKFCNWVL